MSWRDVLIRFEPHNEIVYARKEIDKHVLARINILSSLKDASVTMARNKGIGIKTRRKKDADSGKDHACYGKCLKINIQRTHSDQIGTLRVTKPTPPPRETERV